MAPHISVLRGAAKGRVRATPCHPQTHAGGIEGGASTRRVGDRPEKLSVHDKQQIRAAAQRRVKDVARVLVQTVERLDIVR
jgi:hypothetical protein